MKRKRGKGREGMENEIRKKRAGGEKRGVQLLFLGEKVQEETGRDIKQAWDFKEQAKEALEKKRNKVN